MLLSGELFLFDRCNKTCWKSSIKIFYVSYERKVITENFTMYGHCIIILTFGENFKYLELFVFELQLNTNK